MNSTGGYVDLQARLGRLMYRMDPRVVQDLIMFFAPQLRFANDDLLLRLYKSASANPHSSTRALFRERNGLVFNTPHSSGMRSSSAMLLMLAYWSDLKPLVAKFTVDQDDAEREHEILQKLLEPPSVPGIVGPVELIKRSRGDGPGVRTKCAILMPVYPATLQQVPPPMSAAGVLECGQQLKNTLTHIHAKGYGHNDVKAVNVFLDKDGNCVLGDFGSAQRLGTVPNECTTMHWPAGDKRRCGLLPAGGHTSGARWCAQAASRPLGRRVACSC